MDELAWGAIWLYKATNDKTYLDKAKTYIEKAQPAIYWAHNWDNVSIGTYVLLYKETGNTAYKSKLEEHLNYWINSVPKTPGGLAFLDQWGSLRYASTTAYIALAFAKNLPDGADRDSYIAFAKKQMDYILGDNPRNSSYVVGFGNNYPINPHHRASHNSQTNNINDPVNNEFLLEGALVGGPKSTNDFDYKDDRTDYIANEVSTDYNAGFTSALAGLIELTK
jgi:endoglucanase